MGTKTKQLSMPWRRDGSTMTYISGNGKCDRLVTPELSYGLFQRLFQTHPQIHIEREELQSNESEVDECLASQCTHSQVQKMRPALTTLAGGCWIFG